MTQRRDEFIRARKAAAFTQESLAEAMSVDRVTVCRWERGEAEPLPYRRPKLARLLRLSLCDLEQLLVSNVGSPKSRSADEGGATKKVSPAVAELCDVLTHYEFAKSHQKPQQLRDLKRDLSASFDAYQQSRFTVAAGRVSTLLADAVIAAGAQGGNRSEAYAVLALSYQVAASVLIKCGEPDVAWIAAERGMTAADKAESPAVHGSLARTVAFSLVATGRLEAAMRLIESCGRFLKSEIGKTKAMSSVYGTLFLVGAMASARFGDAERTTEYLQEADEMAQRVGRDGNDLWTAFGPTNVAIHRVNTAAELGDMGTVLKSVVPIHASPIPVERKVRYLLDVARARAFIGDREEALSTIMSAERMAPEHVRHHYLAGRVVSVLIEGESGTSNLELEKLARRVAHLVAH